MTTHPDATPVSLLYGFPPEEYRARREQLRAACPDALILLRGATEEETHGARYRQNSHFLYLTGVDAPGAFLVLLPQGLPASLGLRDVPPEVREILFLPARNPQGEIWTGPKLVPGEETEKQTGVEKTADVSRLWDALTGWLRHLPALYTVAPFGEHARLTREYALIRRVADIAPITRFLDCSLPLARLRMVKSPAEVACVREAIAVTCEAQKVARRAIASLTAGWEYEVEAQVLAAFRQRNAVAAFPSIIGAGPNALVLHYEANNAPIRPGDLVVVDIGARAGAYCSDLTRTYPAGGRFTPRQAEIYDLVFQAHQYAVQAYRPGEDSLKSLNERCKEYLRELPVRAQDACGEEKTMDAFMPHGLCHHLGLDVHDVGVPEIPLPFGSVITIEPGLYIPSEGIGIRIEDDYLVTEQGLELLGPPLEKERGALEAALSGNG